MSRKNYNGFIIQRGRQQSVLKLFKTLDLPDIYFDFRPSGPLVRIRLFLKLLITAYELPTGLTIILCEGSLCTMVAFFYKLVVNRRSIIISYVVDPTFWSKDSKPNFAFLVRAFLHRKLVRHTVAITEMVKQDAIFHNFCGTSSISVIQLPSFREVPKYYSSHADRSFSISNKAKIVYMADRPADSGYTKGLDIYISIARNYSLESASKHEFYLIGKGTESYDNLLPNMKGLGHISDISSLFSASDLFVLPSRYDASSIALLEAIGYGLMPIVSSRVGYSSLLRQSIVPEYDPVVSSGKVTEWVAKIDETLALPTQTKDRLISSYYSNCKKINFTSATSEFASLLSGFSTLSEESHGY